MYHSLEALFLPWHHESYLCNNCARGAEIRTAKADLGKIDRPRGVRVVSYCEEVWNAAYPVLSTNREIG